MSNLINLVSNAQAILLDRDGCLNRKSENSRYVEKSTDIEFYSDAVEFVRVAVEKGLRIAVITNQQGISKNLYKLDDVIQMHQELCKLANVKFEDIALFVCPHEDATCDCRKPSPKMLLQACGHFQVLPESAIFIGDSESDMQAAENAGMPFISMVRILESSEKPEDSRTANDFKLLTSILQNRGTKN